jgi:hypothetical protein
LDSDPRNYKYGEIKKMRNFRNLAACSILLSFAASAAEPELILSEELLAKQSSGLYVVQMSELPAIAYDGSRPGYAATKPGKGKKLNPNSAHVKKYVEMLDSEHGDALQSVGAAGEKIYDYHYSFNGFAACRFGRMSIGNPRPIPHPILSV